MQSCAYLPRMPDSLQSDYGFGHEYLKRFCVAVGITEKFRILCPDLQIDVKSFGRMVPKGGGALCNIEILAHWTGKFRR